MSATALRDVARQAVREQVLRSAWELFAAHGFEATTIDQVAEAAGMSRRTFFRYFTGKDELILERLVEAGERVADALRARPADEAAWPALRAAFDELVAGQEAHPEVARRLGTMLRDEPGVRASAEERRRRWTETLRPLVAQRLADPADGVRAAAMTGAALACLDAAQQAWTDRPTARLARLLDQAMSAVAPLS